MNTDRSFRDISKGSLGPKLKQICLEFGGANEFHEKKESPPSSGSSYFQPLSMTEKINQTPAKTKRKTVKSLNVSANQISAPHIVKTPKPLMMSFVGKMKEKIKQVRLRIGFGNIENLKLKQLNWINDISYYSLKQDLKGDIKMEKGKKKNMTVDGLVRMTKEEIRKRVDEITNIIDDYHFPRLSRLLKRISVTKLNSRFKLYFDVLMALLIIFLLYLYSISFFFSTPITKLFTLNQEDITSSGGFEMFMVVALGLFITDIILTLNTGFYEAGNFVVNRRKIVNNYWKKDFVNDVVSLIPMCSSIFKLQEQESQQWLGLLFLLKFKKVQKILTNFEDVLQINEKYESILSLVNLITKIITVAHIMACLWHYFSMKNPDPENWIIKRNLIDSSVESKYIYSLYWAITTMITVGYGDITPQNVGETLICMGCMMTGCAMFGYAINKIGFIFDNMNRNKNDFKKYVRVIDLYMRNKSIEKGLQVRVRKYLEYVWNEEKVQNTKAEEEILTKLSSKLREELLMQSYGRIFNQLPFFSKNFSPEAIRKLVLIIKQVRFYPKETIYEKGEKQERSLFIIANGDVDIFYDKARIKRLSKGDFFGEISFFSGLEPDLTVVGSSFGTIYKINRNDFMQTLREFPLDYETFSFIKDQIILNNNLSGLQLSCPSCDRQGHSFTTCSYIRYIPIRSITMNKYLHSPFQERGAYLRSKRKFWSLKQQPKVKERLEEFQKTLPIDEENPESSVFSLNGYGEDECSDENEELIENEDEAKKESDHSLKNMNSTVTTPTNSKPNEIQNFLQKNTGYVIDTNQAGSKNSWSSFNRSGSQAEESVGIENSNNKVSTMVEERKNTLVRPSHFSKMNEEEPINELKESEERSPSFDENVELYKRDSGPESSYKSLIDGPLTSSREAKKTITNQITPKETPNSTVNVAANINSKQTSELASKIEPRINPKQNKDKKQNIGSPLLNIVEIENALNDQIIPKIPLNQKRRESIRATSAQPPNTKKRRESLLKGIESPNVNKGRRQSFSLNPFFRVDDEGRNNTKKLAGQGPMNMFLVQMNETGAANIIASPSFQMLASPQKLRSEQKLMSFSNIPLGGSPRKATGTKQPQFFNFKDASRATNVELNRVTTQTNISGTIYASSADGLGKLSPEPQFERRDRRQETRNFERNDSFINNKYNSSYKDGEVTPTYRSRTNNQKAKNLESYDLFFKGMDQGFIFTKYFVHNNMDKILKQLDRFKKRKSMGLSLKTGVNSRSPRRKPNK